MLAPLAMLPARVPAEREFINLVHRRRQVVSNCPQIIIGERPSFELRPDLTDISVSCSGHGLFVQVTTCYQIDRELFTVLQITVVFRRLVVDIRHSPA